MEGKLQLDILDNLEMLALDQQQTAFPSHYHDTFCISLVREGMEILDVDGVKLHTEKGQVSITNPYEVHANPLVDTAVPTAFDTLYLSQDVVDHYWGSKNVHFHKRQLSDPQLVAAFSWLKETMQQSDGTAVESAVAGFVTALKPHQTSLPDIEHRPIGTKWKEITLFIQHHLREKISLDQLAHFANMDKFHFAKTFKVRFGMSPMNYILMQKIFAAKALISQDNNLTEVAYQFGFADQAHFSKTFKRFIGLSPRSYLSKRF